MNEFTKNELIEIKRCLKYMIKGSITPYSILTLELNKKIQAMIDNYCEHDFIDIGIIHYTCKCGLIGNVVIR